MEEALQIVIKNSEMAVPKEKLDFLAYPAEGLCPCRIDALEDCVAFDFGTEGMEPAKSVDGRAYAEKLRFLVNAADLEKAHVDYVFSLSPSNLMVDINLRPWALRRDLNTEGDEFLVKYKALIGEVISSKYTYENYLCGPDLFSKHKLLCEISKLESAVAAREFLAGEYAKEIRYVEESKILVSKTSILALRILLPLSAALLAVATFFALRAYIVEAPYHNSVIEASQAYIAGDYISAQQALKDYSPSDLTYETRHLLSRAYVITQPLSDEQKENVLVGLTRMTDVSIFDYWIYVGRLDFDSAVEIAQRYGDSELLLFAYIKQEAYIRADTTIPGEERAEKLAFLEKEITRLEGERDLGEDD